MSKSLSDLRAALFETLESVKNGSMELDKARAINEIGKTLIDSAKVEVQYLEAIGGTGESPFIAPPDDQAPQLPNGIVGITRHRLQG
jgi:hypothetical protein